MSTNPPNPVRLPVLVNLTTNERYELNSPSITIGRAPENNVIVPNDGYASGNHARVYWDQGRWWLEDLNSSNGTTVNDKLITGAWQLNPKDVIKVGRTLFRIE
jgi:pSer/pThr/pTyr-binding forkhead associated (FHA) protein